MKLADELFGLLNEGSDRIWKPNYNRYYIGVMDGRKGSTFVLLRPRKQFLHLRVQFPQLDPWMEKVEEAGLDCTLKSDQMFVTLKPGDAKKHRELLSELLAVARKNYAG